MRDDIVLKEEVKACNCCMHRETVDNIFTTENVGKVASKTECAVNSEYYISMETAALLTQQ